MVWITSGSCRLSPAPVRFLFDEARRCMHAFWAQEIHDDYVEMRRRPRAPPLLLTVEVGRGVEVMEAAAGVVDVKAEEVRVAVAQVVVVEAGGRRRRRRGWRWWNGGWRRTGRRQI